MKKDLKEDEIYIAQKYERYKRQKKAVEMSQDQGGWRRNRARDGDGGRDEVQQRDRVRMAPTVHEFG